MGCKVFHMLYPFVTGMFIICFFPPRFLGPVPHDSSYYAKCMLGGVLACGVTHAGITPLDVAKCNIQVSLLVNPTGFTRLTSHPNDRSTPQNTRALARLSPSLPRRKVPLVFGKVSDPRSSATHSRVCSSTVCTRFSRTCT